MKPAPCVVSAAEHTGWAHLLCVAAHGEVPAVIERRRVRLVDAGLPTQPYEHDTRAMREDDANALIARVRRSASAHALEALQRLLTDLSRGHAIVALAIRKPPFDDLPDSVTAVWSSHRWLSCADGMLYQLALCRAARQLGLDVQMYRRREETSWAAAQLGVTPAAVEQFVGTTGRPAGPPWTQEHRQAYAAGIAALAARAGRRLRLPAANPPR